MKNKTLFNPIIIFVFLWIIVLFASFFLQGIEFKIFNSNKIITINNLLSINGIMKLGSNTVKYFINFNVLPIVLIVSLGIGVAEETKFIEKAIKLFVLNIPTKLITPLLLFVGIIGNVAGSASFAIIPPLGAIIFKSSKKNPVLGIITGFAGVAGGLSANIFISTTDVISSGITQSASSIIDKTSVVLPTANWYFFSVSTILLMLFGTIVIEYVVSPMLGNYTLIDNVEKENDNINSTEKKALKYSLISLILYVFLVFVFINDFNLILKAVIPLITLFFLIPSIVYGVFTEQIKRFNDVVDLMSKSIAKLSGFIVLCFFASQFIGIFDESKMGLYVAYLMTSIMINFNINIYAYIFMFLIFSMILNIFIGSMSAKWVIMAPIFIPLFMNLGFSPSFGQLVFRIADSITNPVSPLEPFVPFILVCMNKHIKNIGFLDLFKFMSPISFAFFITWGIQLIVWIVFNINIGPNSGIYLGG